MSQDNNGSRMSGEDHQSDVPRGVDSAHEWLQTHFGFPYGRFTAPPSCDGRAYLAGMIRSSDLSPMLADYCVHVLHAEGADVAFSFLLAIQDTLQQSPELERFWSEHREGICTNGGASWLIVTLDLFGLMNSWAQGYLQGAAIHIAYENGRRVVREFS